MTPALRQRSDRDFERIYRRHVGAVYRYALALIRNRVDAEDVAHATFRSAYRAFQRGEFPAKPRSWLIGIAHGLCHERTRDAVRTHALEPHELSDAPSVEDIWRALAHLDFDERAAFVLHELEGRPCAVVADFLGIGPSAVETLLFDARRALREELERSLTCGQAERAVSKELDGMLGRNEKSALRVHIRECNRCAEFARRLRLQRRALRSLRMIRTPTSLLPARRCRSLSRGLAVQAAAGLAAGFIFGTASIAAARDCLATSPSSSRPPAPAPAR